jgi:flagellar biosynthesis GTPase FlhF
MAPSAGATKQCCRVWRISSPGSTGAISFIAQAQGSIYLVSSRKVKIEGIRPWWLRILSSTVRVAAAAAKEAKEKEKERKAAKRAELQRKEKEEKEAASTQKALHLSQRGKRKASPKSKPKAKRTRVAQPAEGSGSGEAPATPPPTKNTKIRTVKLPVRFLNMETLSTFVHICNNGDLPVT